MTNQKMKPTKKKILRNTLLFSIAAIFLALSIGFFGAIEEISESEAILKHSLFLTVFLGASIILIIVAFFISKGIYNKEYFYISDNKLNYEFTFIIKRRILLPLEKINIVKVKRNLIDLILGTATVEIGSGNMTTSLKAEIKLCFDKKAAYQYADYLQEYSKAVKENKEFEHKIFNIEENNITHNEKVIIKMSIKDKLKYSFTNIAMFIMVLVIAIMFISVCVIGMLNPENYTEYTFIEVLFGAIVLGFILLLITFICGLIAAFIAFYDYRVEKLEDGLKISYGLLNKKCFYATFDKIHGYVINRNLIAQIFKFSSIKLSVIGIDESNNQNNNGFSFTYLYPCAGNEKIKELIKTFLPAYEFSNHLYKSTKKSIWHTIVIPIISTLIILSPIFIYLGVVLGITVLVLPFLTLTIFIGLNGYFTYRYAGFGISKDFLCTQSGGLIKSYSIVKTSAVQEISTYAGFIRQKHNLCTYYVFYRGSNIFMSRIFVRNVPKIELDELN